jgi:hypothetical protein
VLAAIGITLLPVDVELTLGGNYRCGNALQTLTGDQERQWSVDGLVTAMEIDRGWTRFSGTIDELVAGSPSALCPIPIDRNLAFARIVALFGLGVSVAVLALLKPR